MAKGLDEAIKRPEREGFRRNGRVVTGDLPVQKSQLWLLRREPPEGVT